VNGVRLWLYRALALVGIPAALLLGLEAGLRLGGYGRSALFLIPDAKPGYLRTNPEFVNSFLPSAFDLRPLNYRVPIRKPAGAIRVVVLGESAAQGIPAPSFGFAAQLRAQLRARYPGRDIEVINTGIVAINSHIVRMIARQAAKLSPDLFVVYMGNNEVVGPFGPGCAYLPEMPPLWFIRLSLFVRSTRTGQLVNALAGRFALHGRRPLEWGGMSMFVNSSVRGDDPRLGAVYRNFEANLRDIVRAAEDAGAKTLLCTVASNLKDCPPLLSLHRAGLSDEDMAAWNRAYNRGRIKWLLGKTSSARGDLVEALRLDPQYADTEYILGSIDLDDGDVASARRRFIEAERWDALRFRPDPRINEIIRQVAGQEKGGVALLDAAVLMGSDPASTVVPAGRELFFEHVHFDWAGNHLLARAMAERADEALAGPGRENFAWLDSQACADAVGYTAHERLPVLQRLATIVENPPFTDQLTYCEDEARLAHDLAGAGSAHGDAGETLRAREVVRAAVANDPGNPDLAKISEDIDDDLGDVAGALAEARRAQLLQPWNFALATDEAIKLSRLRRYGEAEALLGATARRCSPRDLSAMAPAFADLFTREGRISEGRRYLDNAVAGAPADLSLRLARARLARKAGDPVSAERDFRGVLADDPANQAALEGLVGLLNEIGQKAAAERETLAAAESQPRNQANNLRAAIICDSSGDAQRETRYLLAAERSGPVNSAVELKLARKLLDLRRPDEALTHLAEARLISIHEGDPSVTEQIRQVIENLLALLR
jgi:tetratricopeptide (TPR) repeat protein